MINCFEMTSDPCQSKETRGHEHPGSFKQSGGVSVLSARGFHSTGLESQTDARWPSIREDTIQGTPDTWSETRRSSNREAKKSTKRGGKDLNSVDDGNLLE